MSKFLEFLSSDSEQQRINPYIIAEIGVNHEGNLNLAKRQIDQISAASGSCAKFQTYKADKIASLNSPAYWDLSEESTKTQHDLFKKYDVFGDLEYKMLADYCSEKRIDYLSTPFDAEAVDFLDDIQDMFKIASADLTNKELLQAVSSKRKPIILSVGASSDEEIERSVNYLKDRKIDKIILLHCVLNYPTDEKDANLFRIKYLREHYPDLIIGYSDHVKPDESLSAVVCAMELGATVIEKHFTHDKTLPGNDHYHSMGVDDLAKLCLFIEKRKMLRGSKALDLTGQMKARHFARRGLYAKCDIEIGDKLLKSHIIAKRPPGQLDPWLWDELEGKEVNQQIKAGEEIKAEMLLDK